MAGICLEGKRDIWLVTTVLLWVLLCKATWNFINCVQRGLICPYTVFICQCTKLGCPIQYYHSQLFRLTNDNFGLVSRQGCKFAVRITGVSAAERTVQECLVVGERP